MDSPADILAANGPLAARVDGFAPRPEQQAMAEAVAQALDDKAVLVAEAGTGTGKTFAYLVPAMLSGRKIIISTGTRNLQDQLFHRDVPVVREALAVPVSVALLKGRANYLCLHRLGLAEESTFASRQQARLIHHIRDWALRTRSGDIAECADIDENDPVWPQVTSNRDNCLGQECPDYEDCHLMQARRAAQAADIVIINHHLLFADMALREEGIGELLPQADGFIIDEAHQLPETASGFFGEAVTGNQLLELARDVREEYLREINEGEGPIPEAEALEKATKDLRLVLGEAGERREWSAHAGRKAVKSAIETVASALDDLDTALTPLADRARGLENTLRRCQDLAERFARLTGPTPEGHIHWLEIHKRSFTLHLTPMNVAPAFREQMQALNAAWIFTSATLAVADQFDHFTEQLGLDAVRTAKWDSPFDYPRQSVLYVPEGLPQPNDPGYTDALLNAALPVLAASRGRAFLLFTSHRALREAAERLAVETDYTLFVQGEAPRGELVSRFRRTERALLLGTSSFWEGVDVRGDALSCVIIDRLPFASPGDPVLKARIERLKEEGVNAFMDYQLPRAVIALKQGAGRLIRDRQDRGVLMVGDPRLVEKPYGRLFLESLPPMTRTRKLEVVQRFFRLIEAGELPLATEAAS